MDSFKYDRTRFGRTLESDHHCNFVSFKEDIFSEPFQGEDGVFDCNFSPAKYCSTKDQKSPYIYGNENFHIHRWIKSLWQISPVPRGVDYNE